MVLRWTVVVLVVLAISALIIFARGEAQRGPHPVTPAIQEVSYA
jgi:hypothetical protein